MNEVGNFSIKPFSINRRVLSDFYDKQSKKHNMIGLLEVDVSKAKQLISQYQEKTGEKISFISWVAKCTSEALNEQPEIHSMRYGKKKLVIFEDIDISVMVERSVNGKKIPVAKILRKTNEKTIEELSREIRQAQTEEVKESNQLIGDARSSLSLKLFMFFPKFIRRFIFGRTLNNPFKVKKDSGTVIITSVGMFAKEISSFVIPFGFLPINIALGGMKRKPGIANDEIKPCTYLQITLIIDHDTVDGAPATRFVARLVELMEGAFGLEFIQT